MRVQKTNKPRRIAEAFEAPRVGLEPTTYRLTADRSTIELTGNLLVFSGFWPAASRVGVAERKIRRFPGDVQRQSIGRLRRRVLCGNWRGGGMCGLRGGYGLDAAIWAVLAGLFLRGLAAYYLDPTREPRLAAGASQ
jgi:hypothetical protein